MNVTGNDIDALKELINIGVGRAAGSLNRMLKTHISLQVPYVKIFSPLELKDEIAKEFNAGKLSAVRLVFRGPFTGNASLVFPPDSAAKLVDIVTGEEPGTADLDALRIGALTEVGNIVLNGVMGSIGNILKQHIRYSLPTYSENTIEDLLTLNVADSTTTIVLAQTHFVIEQFKIEGDIVLLFEVGSFDALLVAIDSIRPGGRETV